MPSGASPKAVYVVTPNSPLPVMVRGDGCFTFAAQSEALGFLVLAVSAEVLLQTPNSGPLLTALLDLLGAAAGAVSVPEGEEWGVISGVRIDHEVREAVLTLSLRNADCERHPLGFALQLPYDWFRLPESVLSDASCEEEGSSVDMGGSGL